VVEHLVDHDPVEVFVLEGQLVNPGGVEGDPALVPLSGQLLRGDLQHAGVHVDRFDPADIVQHRLRVVAGTAPGVQDHRPIQRHGRVGEAAD
jgi:hypothetical protein